MDKVNITFSTAESVAHGLQQDARAMRDIMMRLQNTSNNLYASGLQGSFLGALDARKQRIFQTLLVLCDEQELTAQKLHVISERFRQLDQDSAVLLGTSGTIAGGLKSADFATNLIPRVLSAPNQVVTREYTDGFSRFPYHNLRGSEVYRTYLDEYSSPANSLSDYVHARAVLWDHNTITSEQLYERQLGDLVTVRVLGYDQMRGMSLHVDKHGFTASADYKADAHLGHVKFDSEIAGAQIAAEGYIGATLHAGTRTSFNPLSGQMEAAAHFDAFAGGRIGGSVGSDLGTVGLESVAVTGRGSVSYGIGAKLDADLSVNAGVLKGRIDTGLTLGLGAEAGIDIEFDVKQFTDDVRGLVSFTARSK